MSELLRRLLAERSDEVAAWVDALEPNDDDELTWDVTSRRYLLETVRAYDPRARFAEELTVRLVGEVAESGRLSLELTPFLDGVRRAFADGGNVGMSLAGVSAGSTVLHFRPTEVVDPEPVGGADSVQVDATQADAAGRDFVALVAAAEAEGDVRRWVQMIRGLEEAVDALESQNLDAQLTWSSLGGSVQAAQLTWRGRGYVRALASTTPRERRRVVHGRVVELRETGRVKLKTGGHRNSPVHEVDVPSDVLLGMHLELGQEAHFLVVETVLLDKLARESEENLRFVHALTSNEAAEHLPGFDDE